MSACSTRAYRRCKSGRTNSKKNSPRRKHANDVRLRVLVAELTNFYEFAMCGKWLSLLKELAPAGARFAVLQNPDHPSWSGYWQSIATRATEGASSFSSDSHFPHIANS